MGGLLDIKRKKNIYSIGTKHGIVVVTEDHSLLDRNRETMEPCDLVLRHELLHNHLDFCESKTTFDEINLKIYNIEPRTLRERETFIKGCILADGSSGVCNYKKGVKQCWRSNIYHFRLIEKLQRYFIEVWMKSLEF